LIGETNTVAKDTAASARPGVGTGVFTWYDLSTWAGSATKMSIDPQNHFKQDDVLFHEFVHALLMMHGLSFSAPIAVGRARLIGLGRSVAWCAFSVENEIGGRTWVETAFRSDFVQPWQFVTTG